MVSFNCSSTTVSGEAVALVLEFREDELAFDEIVQRVHLCGLDFVHQFRTAIGAAQLGDDRLDVVANITVGDDLVVDDGGHAVHDLGAARPATAKNISNAIRMAGSILKLPAGGKLCSVKASARRRESQRWFRRTARSS